MRCCSLMLPASLLPPATAIPVQMACPRTPPMFTPTALPAIAKLLHRQGQGGWGL